MHAHLLPHHQFSCVPAALRKLETAILETIEVSSGSSTSGSAQRDSLAMVVVNVLSTPKLCGLTKFWGGVGFRACKHKYTQMHTYTN